MSGVWDALAEATASNKAMLGAGLAAAASVAYLMSGSSHQPVKPSIDLNDQTVQIDGKPYHRASRQAYPPDYVNFEINYPGCNTVYHSLLHGRDVSNNGPCLGTRTGPNRAYEWLSFQEVLDMAHRFGSGLIHKGIKPCNESRIGIYAKNCFQWVVTDYGCQAYSMCPVAIYDTLTPDSVAHILRLCEMEVVVVDKNDHLKTLLGVKSAEDKLRLIVLVEAVKPELKEEAHKLGLELLQFEEFLELGKTHFSEPPGPQPEDLYTICFTSGTTGNPKGAMMTHGGFMKMIDSGITYCKDHVRIGVNDVYISYLPLAHNFERASNAMVLCNHGGRVGFFGGDVKGLMDDIATLRPTMFFTVPRLLNRIYDTVVSQVRESAIKATLFKWAIASKQGELDRGIIRNDSIWDRLMFKKIQEKMGGRLRILMCSSAPLSKEVMQFARCAFGCWVVEGYGQTEAGAGISCTTVGDNSLGTVGVPWPGIHLKLVDVPEMDYYAKNNVGELCVKSEFNMKGYFKDPKLTAETIDEEGWLHTGDVATFAENGTLKLVDRKKNIFKLAQGEFIAVEKIENIYRSSSFVGQIFIEGNSLKPCLMAVIVPDEDYVAKWGPGQGLPSDLAAFCKHPGIKDKILKDLLDLGKKAGLKGYEQVKDIVLESHPFTIEEQLLTPTLKNKRPKLKAKYKEQIDSLYKAHGF